MTDNENSSGIESPEVPRTTTPTGPIHVSGGHRRLLTYSEPNALRERSNDPQLLILAEVKKTNTSLDNVSTRMDTMERRLIAVEQKQIDMMTPGTSSSANGSSAEKTKKKIPARIRVSL